MNMKGLRADLRQDDCRARGEFGCYQGVGPGHLKWLMELAEGHLRGTQMVKRGGLKIRVLLIRCLDLGQFFERAKVAVR